MIYSRSAEYAIRAFVHLAPLPPGEFAMVKHIAAEAAIPSHFLAKILQELARDGFLQSSKGPHGGFRLHQPPEEISMLKIVEAVDGAGRYDRCIGGLPSCTDRAPCGMHDSWKALRSRIIEYLEETSIADLANSLGEKRRLLARPRRRGSHK
jgi:Rrf2 family iron-sulfur cluster assembly transcriptional regulator